MPRSNTNERYDVHFSIKKDGAPCFDVSIPDCYGETFEQILLERVIDAKLAPWVEDCNSILFFIHATKKELPFRIDNVTTVTDAIQQQSTPVTSTQNATTPAEPTKPKLVPFEHKKLPTGVKIVELLQMLLQQVNHKKVAIMISAWDAVTYATPEEYLAAELPLVSQFIESSQKDNFLVVGISAQGGDISKPEVVQTLLNTPAHERVKINIGGNIKNNFDDIIVWLND